jgi:hypothetical protein
VSQTLTLDRNADAEDLRTLVTDTQELAFRSVEMNVAPAQRFALSRSAHIKIGDDPDATSIFVFRPTT